MFAMENNRYLWNFESESRMRMVYSIPNSSHPINVGEFYEGDASEFYKQVFENDNYWNKIDNKLLEILYEAE